MRAVAYLQAAVVAAATLGGSPHFTAGLPVVGPNSAEAKEFYTRKRVNGRWITGHFAKRPAATRTRKAAQEKPARGRASAARDAASRDTTSKDTTSRDMASVASTTGVASTAASIASTTASIASPRPARAASSAPERGEVLPERVRETGPEPLEASPSAPLVAPPNDERMVRLRQALQARANAMTTGSISPPQASRAASEPQSIAFDLQSGVKTTFFSDGTFLKEPFDVAALKGLASAPPPSARQPGPPFQ